MKTEAEKGQKKVPNLVLGTAVVQKPLLRCRLDTRPQAPRADGGKEHRGQQAAACRQTTPATSEGGSWPHSHLL